MSVPVKFLQKDVIDHYIRVSDFAIAWSGMLVFDGWIFALTLVRGIILSRRARRTLFDIMLRDGDYS